VLKNKSIRKLLKRTVYFFIAGGACWIIVAYLSASYLTSTNQVFFDDISTFNGYNVQNLSFKTDDNIDVSSWYIQNSDSVAIILLSGIKGNRTHQLKRASFYLKKGFSILLPDLRGTGKTKGDIISFGWHERKDLQACIKGLKEMNIKHISANGQSLGAATIVYSFKEMNDLDFVILESCYDNISNAFKNRVDKYPIPMFLFEPVKFFTERIIQEPQISLSPEQLIKKVTCPTLIIAGDKEDQIPIHETIKLYNNCGTSNKNLHFFKGGKHEDLYERFPDEYEKVISDFLHNQTEFNQLKQSQSFD